MPSLGGPRPQTPVWSVRDQVAALTGGKAITYWNPVSLKQYAGTVTSITPGISIVLNVPNLPAGASVTLPLNPMDGSLALPVGIPN